VWGQSLRPGQDPVRSGETVPGIPLVARPRALIYGERFQEGSGQVETGIVDREKAWEERAEQEQTAADEEKAPCLRLEAVDALGAVHSRDLGKG